MDEQPNQQTAKEASTTAPTSFGKAPTNVTSPVPIEAAQTPVESPQFLPAASQETQQPSAPRFFTWGRVIAIIVCLLIDWPIVLAGVHPAPATNPGETHANVVVGQYIAFLGAAVLLSLPLTRFSMKGLFVRIGALFTGIGLALSLGNSGAPLYAYFILFGVGLEFLFILPFALQYMLSHPIFVKRHATAIAIVHFVCFALAVALSIGVNALH